MRARIDLPTGLSPGMDRVARRAAVWSLFLRNLYGTPRGTAIGGLAMDELPDADALGSLTRSQLVARPHVLRRLIAPLVLARPVDPASWSGGSRELVLAAVRNLRPATETFEQALDALREWGRSRFGTDEGGTASARIRAARRLLDPEDFLEVAPSTIQNRNGVFTASRRARVRAPLRAIRDALNPVNWTSMGEFFESVGRVPDRYAERSDGWHGIFEERFVVGWGPFTLSTCHPFLRMDFTFDDDRVRADYALLYEADDQLECDDGYVEATTIPGRAGWCEYFVTKSTRFRSPATNLLGPVTLAVFLESNLSSIEDVAYEFRAHREMAKDA